MLEEILQTIDFLSLVELRVSMKKTGPGKYRGLSPFTSERTPSFYIDVE